MRGRLAARKKFSQGNVIPRAALAPTQSAIPPLRRFDRKSIRLSSLLQDNHFWCEERHI
jgi:hypothetical protein